VAELPSVEAYLDGKDTDAVMLFRRFEELVERCGPSEPAPRSSIVYWKRRRIFAGAYIERGRLELNVDLLREAEHPTLLAAFPTTSES
jgi:predicted SprT family Zn-dependent metalloprotease